MPLSASRPVLVGVALFASACSRPLPGVLTLAPAGMRLSGTCTAHADGTLTMAADCSAESEAYVDAGTVTIRVTAAASAPDQAGAIELWFGGTSVGRQGVRAIDPTTITFQARARANGPVALRLIAHADGPGAAAALAVEKLVITEP